MYKAGGFAIAVRTDPSPQPLGDLTELGRVNLHPVVRVHTYCLASVNVTAMLSLSPLSFSSSTCGNSKGLRLRYSLLCPLRRPLQSLPASLAEVDIGKRLFDIHLGSACLAAYLLLLWNDDDLVPFHAEPKDLSPVDVGFRAHPGRYDDLA